MRCYSYYSVELLAPLAISLWSSVVSIVGLVVLLSPIVVVVVIVIIVLDLVALGGVDIVGGHGLVVVSIVVVGVGLGCLEGVVGRELGLLVAIVVVGRRSLVTVVAIVVVVVVVVVVGLLVIVSVIGSLAVVIVATIIIIVIIIISSAIAIVAVVVPVGVAVGVPVIVPVASALLNFIAAPHSVVEGCFVVVVGAWEPAGVAEMGFAHGHAVGVAVGFWSCGISWGSVAAASIVGWRGFGWRCHVVGCVVACLCCGGAA